MFLATFTYDELPFYDYYFAPPSPQNPAWYLLASFHDPSSLVISVARLL